MNGSQAGVSYRGMRIINYVSQVETQSYLRYWECPLLYLVNDDGLCLNVLPPEAQR